MIVKSSKPGVEMRALFYKHNQTRFNAGYFDCPWKTLTPDYVMEDVDKNDLPPQKDGEVIVYVIEDRPKMMAGTDKRLSAGKYVDMIWNTWP